VRTCLPVCPSLFLSCSMYHPASSSLWESLTQNHAVEAAAEQELEMYRVENEFLRAKVSQLEAFEFDQTAKQTEVRILSDNPLSVWIIPRVQCQRVGGDLGSDGLAAGCVPPLAASRAPAQRRHGLQRDHQGETRAARGKRLSLTRSLVSAVLTRMASCRCSASKSSCDAPSSCSPPTSTRCST
jgi:hypothetical protein